jgi:hypothetical protein
LASLFGDKAFERRHARVESDAFKVRIFGVQVALLPKDGLDILLGACRDGIALVRGIVAEHKNHNHEWDYKSYNYLTEYLPWNLPRNLTGGPRHAISSLKTAFRVMWQQATPCRSKTLES